MKLPQTWPSVYIISHFLATFSAVASSIARGGETLSLERGHAQGLFPPEPFQAGRTKWSQMAGMAPKGRAPHMPPQTRVVIILFYNTRTGALPVCKCNPKKLG